MLSFICLSVILACAFPVPWLCHAIFGRHWSLSHRSNIFWPRLRVSSHVGKTMPEKSSPKTIINRLNYGNMLFFSQMGIAYYSFTHMIHKFKYTWYYMTFIDWWPSPKWIPWLIPGGSSWLDSTLGRGQLWYHLIWVSNMFQIMCILLGTWWNFTDLTNTYKNRKKWDHVPCKVMLNRFRPASHCSWCCCLPSGQIVPW